jgi:hypothetical protein
MFDAYGWTGDGLNRSIFLSSSNERIWGFSTALLLRLQAVTPAAKEAQSEVVVFVLVLFHLKKLINSNSKSNPAASFRYLHGDDRHRSLGHLEGEETGRRLDLLGLIVGLPLLVVHGQDHRSEQGDQEDFGQHLFLFFSGLLASLTGLG